MDRQIDLIPVMEKILEETTTHYREDFYHYDLVRLQRAVQESNIEERTFCWMVRPTGTWLVKERDVFLRGSEGHTIWTHYANEAKGIQAYRVAVCGRHGDTPRGTLQKLDYPKQVKRVVVNAVPAVKVVLTFQSEQVREVSLEEYTKERERFFNQYGMIRHIRYCPVSEEELQLALTMERRSQRGQRSPKTQKPPQHRGR